MAQPMLIGQAEKRDELLHILRDGWKSNGSVVFIEGPMGIGKTTLLKRIQEEAIRMPELKESIFIEAACYQNTSPQNAYQPFKEILAKFNKSTEEREERAKWMFNMLEKIPPVLSHTASAIGTALGFVVHPVIGMAIGAGTKMAAIVGQRIIETQSVQINKSKMFELQYMDMLTRVASQKHFLVLIIKNGQWIDQASCQLLLRIGAKISSMRLVIVVTYSSDALGAEHPLKRVQDELLLEGQMQEIVLQELTEEQIGEYILQFFGNPVHPRLAGWLKQQCNGNLFYVKEYLAYLKDKVIIQESTGFILKGDIHYRFGKYEPGGDLATLSIPDSLQTLLARRIESLPEKDRELLRLGSVQGEIFLSLVLAKLLRRKESTILSRLRLIKDRYHIISWYNGQDFLSGKSEMYVFEHHLMQQAFYCQLGPYEQGRYHRDIAHILEKVLRDYTHPPRRLVLEVAYHYSQGNELAKGAEYYYQAGESSFLAGSFAEAMELCKLARANLERVDGQDKLLVGVLLLLCIVSENWWRGKPETQGDLPLLTLSQEAETAARRTGDHTLIAQALYFKGRALLVVESLQSCIQTLQTAREEARLGDDRFWEIAVMEDLGHHLAAENLKKGLELLKKAHELYQQAVARREFKLIPTKTHKRLLHRIEGRIGVAEFDTGHYDEAETWLTKCIDNLNKLKMYPDLPRFLSFKGQVYMATGLFEEAEQICMDAINIFKDNEEANAWRGYIFALLGKLYIEWERFDEASKFLLWGWKETEETYNVDLVPMVRNYYAELLMHTGYQGRNYTLARELLDTTVKETRKSGFYRSTIMALSLQSRLALQERRNHDAVAWSTEAVELFQRLGPLPVLRSEEVLYNHYQALWFTQGDTPPAIAYLSRAYNVLQEKAATLADPERQHTFLERISLNKSIMRLYNDVINRGYVCSAPH